MKATGEVMSIGNSFELAMMKAVRSIELKIDTMTLPKVAKLSDTQVKELLNSPDDERIFVVYEAIKRGVSLDEIFEITKIDRWFLNKFKNLAQMEMSFSKEELSEQKYLSAKKMGFLDCTIEKLSGQKVPYEKFASYKMVDTCAAEFKAQTPYFYSTWDEENEAALHIEQNKNNKKKIIVFGSGPIRIGQGIEFDYCSVHCVWALKECGYEAIIVNNNPETVSTDFDTSDRLYFDPLTPEDVKSIIETEKPWGVVVQFGGQTAIKLTNYLEQIGANIIGTPADSVDAAEDRERFDEILEKYEIPRPKGQTIYTEEEAIKAAEELGYPVLLRPSYVLGGQNMIIAYNTEDVSEYMRIITRHKLENPVLIDKYLMGKEVEVDAICDGEDILIPGIMEHIERAGVHSGDSISVYPTQTLSKKEKQTIIEYTEILSKALNVIGLVNIQFVIFDGTVYIIEVNPRSSRTVPYISKVTNVPMVDLATRCMLGYKLKDLGYGTGLHPEGEYVAVKVPVFSFAKLHDVDTHLGPEMKSTGEVLGIAKTFHEALMKGLVAAGYNMKKNGGVIITVRDSDKQEIIEIADKLSQLNFKIYATSGTAHMLNKNMIASNVARKIGEAEPNIMTLLESGEIDYIISTSSKGRLPELDSVKIRRKAVERSIPCLTSLDTANALITCLNMKKTMADIELVDIVGI
jgi:carbamoyl-phosphate synthase large subunit